MCIAATEASRKREGSAGAGASRGDPGQARGDHREMKGSARVSAYLEGVSVSGRLRIGVMLHLRLSLLAVLALLALAAPVLAAPVAYRLDADRSTVGFETDFGEDRITGRFPVAEADLRIDIQRPGNSRIRVAIDAAGAEASFPFAAQALKGPRVLDARRFPQIIFESTRVLGNPAAGGRIEGLVTIRGITRPVTLEAQLYRQDGTLPEDLSRLSVVLRGAVSRAAFGADGWADMVGDEVRVVILARIERAE